MMLLINKAYTQETNNLSTCGASGVFPVGPELLHLNKYLFYFKLIFVLFLFILHITFLFSNDPALEESIDCKESVFSNLRQVLKEYSGIFITIAGVYTAQLNYNSAVSQDERVKEIAKTDKHLEMCEQLEIQQETLLAKIKGSNLTLSDASMKFKQILINLSENKTSYNEVKKLGSEIRSILSKLNNSEDSNEKTLLTIQLQEKGIALDNVVKTITKSAASSQELLEEISNIINSSQSSNPDENSVEVNKSEEIIKNEDIKKSSIFNLWDSGNSEEWFNNLTIIKQIAATLILSHTIAISALINIIFIYYGDFLIKKYNLEERYPKLNKIILYRKKFSQFYFLNSCFFIFIICIVYIFFGISILST